MKRHRTLIATSGVILVVLIAWALTSWATHDRFRSTADRLLLLVPDGTSLFGTLWAREHGQVVASI